MFVYFKSFLYFYLPEIHLSTPSSIYVEHKIGLSNRQQAGHAHVVSIPLTTWPELIRQVYSDSSFLRESWSLCVLSRDVVDKWEVNGMACKFTYLSPDPTSMAALMVWTSTVLALTLFFGCLVRNEELGPRTRSSGPCEVPSSLFLRLVRCPPLTPRQVAISYDTHSSPSGPPVYIKSTTKHH
jgi:hypothetical protein